MIHLSILFKNKESFKCAIFNNDLINEFYREIISSNSILVTDGTNLYINIKSGL